MAYPTPTAATPMAFVAAIVEGYRRRGRSPAGALAAAQIAPARVTDVHDRITAAQMERISDHAMRELDDEALGWFERRLPWGSYGLLARASISAPTLGVALKRWCRHHGLLADDLALRLQGDGEHAEVALTERRDLGPLREFCQVSVLRNLLGVASWLIDSRIPLQAAAFAWPTPPHAEAYRVLFPAPARFDAPQTRLRFDARYLALPLRRDEQALNQMLQHALPLLVQPYRRDRLLVDRARRLLRTEPEHTHNAESLAARLHVSARTLHRQLQEQGHSLQALKDAVRRERATELLLRTRQPVKQVAQAAGFQSEKSFIRAFKGWTGQTPAAYRRQTPGYTEPD
ncbi:AraC family transcriptional regulator [Aquabacterium sp. A08]|uniref:AraC family transcriptional regulator n=1 Tax=Aquabacterium sp. A08 TaxID=2718532 RepID=UPI001FBC0EE1|nr:AraC family transcriptional regulator [Aquabacterium sp. A08]